MHEEKKTKQKKADNDSQFGNPSYLLERENQIRAKVLAGKWNVPIPKVKGVSEAEVFKVVKSGKTKRKAWKRMDTKVTYVGDTFTRKPAKFERFIRPMVTNFERTVFLFTISGHLSIS